MEDILIIEDDAFLRNACVKYLRRDGRSVRTASDGNEGIEEIERMTPHLLLLDLMLPTVDGFTVLEFIQERQHTFPVIVLSNIDSNFHQKDFERLGITDYFIKSNMDIPDLVAKIEEHLAAAKVK